jgi:hypothetical protein
MTDRTLDAETLRQLLRYEPETGKLYWRERPEKMCETQRAALTWNARFANKEAFTTAHTDGYLSGCIFRRRYQAHRIIWALYFGEWPAGQIDHINGVRTDNRLANLRDVSQSDNQRNAARRRDNISGVTGVYWNKNERKWMAQINGDKRQIHLGYFTNIDDAVAARKAAERQHNYHPSHGRIVI